MFDGNHRSRRTVNMGGSRRRQLRTGASSSSFQSSKAAGIRDRKAEVLESTRIQREQRKLKNRQEAAARDIQRSFRGFKARWALIRSLQQRTSSLNGAELSVLLSLTCSPGGVGVQRQALLDFTEKLESGLNPDDVSFVAKERIIVAAIQRIRPNEDDEVARNKLLNVVRHMMMLYDKIPLSVSTHRHLIEACQAWLTASPTDTSVVECLWGWACQTTMLLNSQHSLALLGITLFGYANDDIFEKLIGAEYCGAVDGVLWSYQTLLPAIADSLRSSELESMTRGREENLLESCIRTYEKLHDKTTSPHSLIQLLQYVSSKSNDLAMLVALYVRGEDIRSIVLEGKLVEAEYLDVDSDEDDAMSDEEENQTVAMTLARKRQKGDHLRTKRLTRQDVQTLPRLDRVYQESFAMLRKDTLSRLESKSLQRRKTLVNLAEHMGTPSLWIEWGTAVLGQESASKKAYLLLFGHILQGCSGGKTSASSPFLSQLVFSRTVLEMLWRQVLVMWVNGNEDEEWTMTATTVFCDLFAHHLIALSDADFLAHYTAAKQSPTILAEHVISRLRDILYDLYWTRPVVTRDVRVASTDLPASRARLLLSGTKLWNSLYERWCRLVRQAPFCDESSWWFPRLAARDDDGAVIRSNENRVDEDDQSDDDSVESMDIEEPSIAEIENDALADSFRDPKMARVLTSIPQALPFNRRVKLFSSLLNADKLTTQDESADFERAVRNMMRRGEDFNEGMMTGREQVKIRRDVLYQDSMDRLNVLGRRLRHKVQVTFINQHGTQEAGIDGGGVFKEFLDDLIKQAFNPVGEEGIPMLFSVSPLQMLAVNLDLPATPANLAHFEFLGRVLGKAMYESILVEPQFCLPFLNQLLGKQNSLEDLKNFDPEYYSNLLKLKTLSAADIANLGLTFELTVGADRTVPLIPGGSYMPVTKANVIHYIHLVAHRRLNIEGSAQTKAFLRGFRDLIPASWVRLFSSYELQKLVSGDDSVQGIDVAGFKNTMQYTAGFHPSQPFVQWFWEVVEEMSSSQQRKLLRFMTSCSRQPLLGFQALDPVPCIQQIRIPGHVLASPHAEKQVPLPSSATCMNLLKLPNYQDKELLRRKLLAAIESGAGFELS